MTEDLSRLPKWALWRLENAEREVERLRADLKAALSRGAEATSPVRVVDRLRGDVGLPPGSTVAFNLDTFPEGREQPARVEVSIDREEPTLLRLRSNPGRLVLVATSSNEVAVTAVPYLWSPERDSWKATHDQRVARGLQP